jgi:predicted metalloprotease
MVAFQSQVQSACGLLKSGNAMYCRADNTVYYDVVFLTAEMKAYGNRGAAPTATTRRS